MRARKNPPRLMLSGLTGRIYIATRYRDLGNGTWEASEKYDVTNDFLNLYAEATEKFTYTAPPAGSRADQPEDSR